MSTKKNIIIATIMIDLLLIAVGVWSYFSPHRTAKNLQAAAEAKDTAKLSLYVDFPALKTDLKNTLGAKMDATAKKSDNPLSMIGAALAGAVVGPMVETFVTPESLALLMKGEKPQNNAPSATAKPQEAETATSYESFDRFVVTVRQKDAAAQPIGLVFQRAGWFSWKLSALRLPL
ncbi:MAG TPA: DUF2939 domain-containing protein [Rhodocyclaceae bacterium]|nr:DUF2939 domain-containing protein [Rhodocyclaceae bacterium]